MVSLAIGWELYERTHSALALGFIGLVQILPVFLLVFVTGHVADRHNRKTIVILSKIVVILGSLGLAATSYAQGSLLATYGSLLLLGMGGAFSGPAAAGLPAE